MELILTIFGLSILIGYFAGNIVIISNFLKLIKLNNSVLNFCFKILSIILLVLLINTPALYYPTVKLHGNIKGLAFYFVWISFAWFLIVSLLGWLTVIRDWYLKYKSMKIKKIA